MSIKNMFNALRLGSTLDEHGVGGETCLTRSVRMGLHEAANDFINLGADPNRENAAGEYPLFIALEQQDRRMMVLLVERGASVFLKQNGLTFRERAQKMGLRDVALWAARVEDDRIAVAAAMMPPC